ncbi:unnamed protein product [Ostreobium quekettii]|uniref:Uncharacterized protein n=1 Tax=Ostreobium quekettii TaxID=121088 RepID=A0A8S1J4T8_9CHLO|nr:unnamed protein product [Ostreobium quekettii]|eukprot:evm.model.scf_1661.3 EVM.evm.TU.scf_1661.3   scf_1661:13542-16659(-)
MVCPAALESPPAGARCFLPPAAGSHQGLRHGRASRRDVACQMRLPGLLSSPTPIIEAQEAFENLHALLPPFVRENFASFYSSEMGGIVLEPAAMVVPIEDRMVMRGHGVYDQCLLVNGHLYQLDEHLQRLYASSRKAGLEASVSFGELRKIILHTTAASRKLNGIVRFWLTGGRGTLGISPKEGKGTSFYVLVSSEDKFRDIQKGVRVKTSPVPSPPPYFLTTLTNGFLPHVVATMEAESEDCEVGILVDEDGQVLGAPAANIAMVTVDNDLVVPPHEDTVRGITMERILTLLEKTDDPNLTVSTVVRRHFTPQEAKTALEVFLTTTGVPVMAVTEWDGEIIAEGKPGINTLGFNALINNDEDDVEGSSVHAEVPYGYLTGMEEEEEDELALRLD